MTIWGKYLKNVCFYHQSLEKRATKFVLIMSSNADKNTVSQVDYEHRAVALKSYTLSDEQTIKSSRNKKENKKFNPFTSSISFGVACLLRDATNNLCSMAPSKFVTKTDEIAQKAQQIKDLKKNNYHLTNQAQFAF